MQSMIPDSQKPHNDLIDILIDACQISIDVRLEDGSFEKHQILDPETVWWKTHLINSPTFSRFAYELKSFESHAFQCKNNMSPQRAEVMERQILEVVANYKRSVDAKSSESLRDKHNTQSTLIDKINRGKIERAVTLKGEAKASMLDSMLGKDNREEDN